jgi:hypothetical protein
MPLPTTPAASPRYVFDALGHIGLDQCTSMFARCLLGCPRYAPALFGIRSPARTRPTGQTGSSRHVLAWFGSSSKMRIELSSGLLIRVACIQFYCGAPILTCGYPVFGLSFRARFVPVLASCSLACFPARRASLSILARIGLFQHGSAPAPTLRSVRSAGRRLDGSPYCSSGCI